MRYVNGDSMFRVGGYDEEGDSGRLKCWADNIYFKAQFKESLIEEKTSSSKKEERVNKRDSQSRAVKCPKTPHFFWWRGMLWREHKPTLWPIYQSLIDKLVHSILIPTESIDNLNYNN